MGFCGKTYRLISWFHSISFRERSRLSIYHRFRLIQLISQPSWRTPYYGTLNIHRRSVRRGFIHRRSRRLNINIIQFSFLPIAARGIKRQYVCQSWFFYGLTCSNTCSATGILDFNYTFWVFSFFLSFEVDEEEIWGSLLARFRGQSHKMSQFFLLSSIRNRF